MSTPTEPSFLTPSDTFVHRHIGPSEPEVLAMLQTVGVDSMGQLIDETVPADIRMEGDLDIGPGYGERELIEKLGTIAAKNRVMRSFIGMGYSDCITPPVIQRNVLENPAWYTQYTAYQAEISQGRLEALLNFQTAIADLTGLPLANASLLDEATAAAEAMAMCWAVGRRKRSRFFVADSCHPQTIAVMHTRAEAVGIEITVGDWREAQLGDDCIGALVQYPCTHGEIFDYADFAEQVHAAGGLLVVAADLLALTQLRPPGEFGADVAVGSSQRFGVPLGYGGPHAAFFATSEAYKRQMPGRIIGMSKDAHGAPALRMALQTREQHIRRDKATSNICTSQVLLAVMAGAYAVYHGPEGLTEIATRVHGLTRTLATGLELGGFELGDQPVFDTLCVGLGKRPAREIHAAAVERGLNLRPIDDHRVGISLDETTTVADIEALL
ncbi:MAG: glycine dehydrogenase, partial [Planctomycetota bacterium]